MRSGQGFRRIVPDTAETGSLLNRVELYLKNPSKISGGSDSALALTKKAEDNSVITKYKKGLERSYDLQIHLWMKRREDKIRAGHDGNFELQKTREAENKLIDHIKTEYTLDDVGEKYLAIADYRDRANHNLAERLRVCELAVDAFKRTGNKKLESEALYQVGFTHHFMQDGNKAQEYYLQSLAIGKTTGGRKLQHAYAGAGTIYRFQGNYKLALQYLLEAIRIAEQRRDSTSHVGIINMYLGLIYENLDQWDLAAKHANKSLEIYEKYSETNPGDLISAISSVAKIKMRGDPQAAITFLNGMLKKYPKMPNHGAYQFILGRFMQAYLELKNFSEGQKYCNELLKMADGKPAPIQRSVYHATIRYMIATEQYDNARKDIPKLEAAAAKTKELPYLRDAAFYRYQVDSAQGSLKAALENFRKYKSLNDSVYNETKIKEISQLQIQYETEKKEQDILLKQRSILALTNEAEMQRLLSEKQEKELELSAQNISLLKTQQDLQLAEVSKKQGELLVKDQDLKLKSLDISLLTKEGLLREAKLREERTTKNIIFASAAALLLLLILLFRGFRQKQLANQKINEQNLSLQQMVNEKEWLLKEVHHRVKNNLQTVVSLLESQSAYLESDALLAVQDSQNRVHAMALVHQKLYQDENIASINMNEYLSELISYLRESFNVKNLFISVNIEPIELDVSQAIPVGLIVNEALTNSIKYAFPVRSGKDEVIISLKLQQNSLVELIVADNGIGLNAIAGEEKPGGLGLKLMQGLAGDIEGNTTIDGENGTKIKLIFAANAPLHKRSQINHPQDQYADAGQ